MEHLNALARWSWETSLAATVLIVPALIFQSAFRRPGFAPIRHLFGLLIVARLLLPFAMPSPLSVFNLLPRGAALPASPSVVLSTPPVQESITPSPNTFVAKTFKPPGIQWLCFAWILGAAAILTRILHQHLKIRRLVGGSSPITAGPLAELLVEARATFGTSRCVQIHAVEAVPSPALFGIFRPALLLPAKLVETASPRTLKLILLHELAHVQRWDVLINWFMIVAQALHWFNPLVWLSMRRLRAEQELLCDADVMRHLGPADHRAYGDTLLALASGRSAPISTVIPISSSFNQMKERITMIKQFNPIKHQAFIILIPAVAALVAVLTFTGATTKKPASSQSTEIRHPVKSAEKRIEALRNELERQTLLVQQKQAELDDYRRTMSGLHFNAAEESVSSVEPETIRKLEGERIKATQEYVQFKSLYEGLKSKSRAELRHTLPTAYHDDALGNHLAELSKTEQTITLLHKDYAEQHPEVVRQVALKSNVNKQIEARIDGILSGLATLVEARKAVLESLEKTVVESKKVDAENYGRVRAYFDLKKDLETLRRVREGIYIRFLEAEAENRIAAR